ncbi:MAG: hypothetical protein U1F11_05430 [Steroidobacteraceae bacterium]
MNVVGMMRPNMTSWHTEEMPSQPISSAPSTVLPLTKWARTLVASWVNVSRR